jgi:DNA-binding NarL/FixJ family response regulator
MSVALETRAAAGEALPNRRTVLVVDDFDLVRWGFRSLIGSRPWVERCLTAASGAEACDLTKRYEPHVAIVNLVIGDQYGIELASELRAACARTRILFMCGNRRLSGRAARAAGGSGVMTKSMSVEEILRAVRLIADGGTMFLGRGQPSGIALTAREHAILERIAVGDTNREIGSRLHFSANTVKQHTSQIYRKLGVRNRAEAVHRGQELGLLG